MRQIKGLVATLLLGCTMFGAKAEAQSTKTLVPLGSVSGVPFGYIEYLPSGYSTPPTGGWPIILFLHGAGEAGNGVSPELSKVDDIGVPYEIDHGRNIPAVVICPQNANGDYDWHSGPVDQLVTYALGHYNVNPNRLYVTGLSMGGGGTWDYISDHMDRIAAAVPVCPSKSLNSTKAAQLVAQNLPIWAFHAYDDTMCYPAVTLSSFTDIAKARGAGAAYSASDGYSAAGGNNATRTAHYNTDGKTFSWSFVGQDYKDSSGVPFNPPQMFTEWKDGGHQWDATYSDPKVYEWMLSQVKGGALAPLNGSFETPTLAANAFAYNPTGGNWTFTNNSGIVCNGSAFGNEDSPEGSQAAFVQTFSTQGTNGAITQTVTMGAGTYTVSLKAARRYTQAQQVKVSLGSTVVNTFTPTSSSFTTVTSSPFTVTAGTYTLKIEATSTSGDVTAFIDDVKINPVPPPVGTGTGLSGQYFGTKNLTSSVTTRTDPTVDFDWGNGSPATSVGTDDFSVRWTGQVQAMETGTYSFTTVTDDGVRLWVDGVLLIDKWVNQGATPWSGTISLTSGQKYNIKMEYYDDFGGASAKLYWTRPGGTLAIVPQTQLYPTYVNAPAVLNASFEAPTTTNYVYAPSAASWTFSGSGASGAGLQKPGATGAFGTVAAPAGSQTAFLQNLGGVSQTLNFATTGQYTLSYQAAQRPFYNAANQGIKFSVGGVAIDSWTPPSNTSYNSHNVTFTVNAAGNVVVSFEGTVPVASGDSTALLDNISLTN